MRLIRMNRRSRYRGKICLHCHHSVRDDQVALASTYYVDPNDNGGPVLSYQTPRSCVEVKVVYHRKCVDKILMKDMYDRDVEKEMFEEYRNLMIERYGLESSEEV